MSDEPDPWRYPDWWRGVRWGLTVGLIAGVVLGVLYYHWPRSPDEVGFDALEAEARLHDGLLVGSAVFFFVVSGIIGALRPQVGKGR